MKRRILIYGFGTFFSKILVFFMVPIYTRFFSTGDFGYYDVIISDMQMIVSITFVEIWSGIIRFMFDDIKKHRAIKTFIYMFPFLTVVYSISVYFFSYIIEIKYPFVTVLYGILYLLFSVCNNICRGFEENIKYIISGLISTTVSCLLCVIFAVLMRLGIKFLFVAQCIGYLSAIIYVEISTKAFRNAISVRYKSGSVLEMVQYCLPLMLNSFSFVFLGTYNKNIIIKKLGDNLSGVYAYVGRFSAVVSVLLSVYALAWQEQAFISANDQNREEQYSYYLNEFVKIVGLTIPIYTIVCIAFSPIFGGPQYYGSEIYIPLAILSSYISNLSGVISTVIAVEKETNLIFLSTAIGAMVNFIMASFIIPIYGINASAFSLCISFLITALLRFIFAKKHFNLIVHWKYFVLMLIEIIIIMITLYYADSNLCFNIALEGIFVCIWIATNGKFLSSLICRIFYKVRRIR